MTQTVQARVESAAGWSRTVAGVGIAAVLWAAGLAIYAAYGDPHPKSDQESGVPFLVAVSVVVGALLFGLLVPRLLRAAREGAATRPWGLWLAIASLALCAAFWSGLPVVVGGAASLIGAGDRRRSREDGEPSGSATLAVVLGLVAVVGATVVTVLGNTVLTDS